MTPIRRGNKMSQIDHLLKQWNLATSEARWGVQKVFHNVLTLAAEEKTTLIYGADYRNGSPCLVNSVGALLTVGGGQGIPMQHFGEIVSLYDEINQYFENIKINTDPGTMSPIVAEVLVKNFAPFDEEPPLIQFNTFMQ